MSSTTLLIYRSITIAAIILPALLCVIFPAQLRKLSNVKWLIPSLALISFVYFMGVRYVPMLIKVSENGFYASPDSAEYLLLTNLCPAIVVTISIALLFRRKNFVQSISSWGVMSACLTLCTQLLNKSFRESSWEAIIYQVDGFKGFWMMHFLLYILCLLILMSATKFTVKMVTKNIAWVITYLAYLELMRFTLDLKINISGITWQDWESSEGGVYASATNALGFSYPWIHIFMYSMYFAIELAIIGLRVIMIKRIDERNVKYWFSQKPIPNSKRKKTESKESDFKKTLNCQIFSQDRVLSYIENFNLTTYI